MTSKIIDVALIGAGPYGLSIGAHLRARDVAFRIFGTPMSSWRNNMAAGTFLKSFGFASSLYDPGSTFTLAHFCEERGLPYSDINDPVPIDTFVAYGLEFQRRFVPNLEQTDITSVTSAPEGFALTTQAGEPVLARRVVLPQASLISAIFRRNSPSCRPMGPQTHPPASSVTARSTQKSTGSAAAL